MKLSVNKDKLTIKEQTEILAKAIGIYNIEFEFSDDWADYDKYLIMVNRYLKYKFKISNNVVELPAIPNGIYEVGVIGLLGNDNNTIKKQPTNMLKIPIAFSSAERDAEIYNRIHMQSKEVNPTTEDRLVIPDGCYEGLIEVKVNAVTSAIDENIQPENIKRGVTILGVEGDMKGGTSQDKIATPSTQEQVIIPDEDYDALSSVTIEAVDNTIDDNIQAENIKQGTTILGVAGSVVELNAQSKTVKSTLEQQTITPDVDYNAIDEVIVEPIVLQDKEVTPTAAEQVITYDNDYDGLNEVVVNPVPTEQLNPTIDFTNSDTLNFRPTTGNFISEVTIHKDNNLTANNIRRNVTINGVTGNVEELNAEQRIVKSGLTSQTITPNAGYNAISRVTVEPIVLQDKTITQNGIYTADAGYDGLNEIEVDINTVNNQANKTATPTTSQQVITPDQGYTGLDQVTVNAVTSNIDANIQPQNIISGVTILGVAGSFVEAVNQTELDEDYAIATNILGEV